MKLKNTVYLFLPALLAGCSVSGDWRSASRASVGIAPDPLIHREAVVQVYGADAFGWRGWFAIHTWIAVKRSEADSYTVYDVVGWRKRWRSSVVAATEDIPDRRWYGAKPELLLDRRGEGVDALIDRIETAVGQYPWANEYSAFPGPNSNTFVAWVGRQVPELGLDLPFAAIGSGYVSRSAQSPLADNDG